MKTIRNRPRTSSSVPRKNNPTRNDPPPTNMNNVSHNFDENESDNSYHKPKINPSRNSQWRKLRPPSFQSYVKTESKPQEPSNLFDNALNSKDNKSKIENNVSINKVRASSSNRRAQSLTRQRNNLKNDDAQNNNQYDYDFYFNHQINQSKQAQNELKQSERRKNSINFDEFKNPDGSPRKLSQKFKQLKNQSSKDNENVSQYPKKTNYSSNKDDLLTPRKESSVIRKRRSQSVSNSISVSSNSKENLISTPSRTSKYLKKPNDNETIFKDSESEQIVNSIEIALNRIQKELKEKDNDQSIVNKEAKPVINKKKKRSFIEQKQQNQTTINLPNYEPIENEQKNKSVIEEVKPHVQFIDKVKPPRKKEFVPIIVESNVEREPKSFVEPTKSDFNKKIEFPRDYMKNIYSSFMNSSSNDQ